MSLLTSVEIRRLPAHAAGEVVDAVFAGMSDESRRLRFHLPMTRLPAYLRQELVKLDGCTRAAVAAYADGEPIGIARVAAVSRTQVEAAVAVVDSWQGRGIGRRLFAAAADLAADLGYCELAADVLRENTAMLRLLAGVFPEMQIERDGHVMHVVVDLGVTVGTEPVFAEAS
jgi:GNAT superfamily N-acetyltransferase